MFSRLVQRPLNYAASRFPLMKKFSGEAAAKPASYSLGVQFMHWTMGGAIGACVGMVLLAQNTKDKEKKGRYMFLHKSCGSLAALLLIPRLAIRAKSIAPGPVVGAHTIEHIAANLSHAVMYGFIIFMPLSGVAMGYFGGNGLPFFFTTVPGATQKQPEIAKPAYEWHKKAGVILEYLIPLHIAGALGHFARGHTIFSRILPIGK